MTAGTVAYWQAGVGFSIAAQFLGGDAGCRVKNVLQASVEIKHGKAMYLRPDASDVSSLLNRQVVECDIFMTLRSDDTRQLGEGCLGGLIQYRAGMIEPLGTKHQLEIHQGLSRANAT
jgi:hypothetical protein